MRTEIIFKLVCVKCGDPLEETHNEKNESKIKYSSGQNATAMMTIKPCERCFRIAKRPALLIGEALSLISKMENE